MKRKIGTSSSSSSTAVATPSEITSFLNGRIVPEGTVRAIQHGLTSPERTRELSVVTIDREVGGRTLSIPDSMGTLDDRHMGPITRTERCLTCHGTEETCPGHMGCIELACAVIPDMFMPHVIRAMKVVCQTPNCNATFPFVRVRTAAAATTTTPLDENDASTTTTNDKRETEISTRKTWCPSCNSRLPIVTRSMSKTHVLAIYKRVKMSGGDRDENEEEEGEAKRKWKKRNDARYTVTVTYSPDEIAEFFESKPNEVWESVGYKTKWAHPAWLVRKNLTVIPNNARPYSVHNGNTYADSLTTLYSTVIRMNQIAKRAREDPSTPEFVLQNNYEDLVNAVRAVWDSRKGGVNSKRTIGMVTKIAPGDAAAASTKTKRRSSVKKSVEDDDVEEEEEEEEDDEEMDDDAMDDDDEEEEEDEEESKPRKRGKRGKRVATRTSATNGGGPSREEVHVTYTMMKTRGNGKIDDMLDMAGVTTSATHVIRREPVIPNAGASRRSTNVSGEEGGTTTTTTVVKRSAATTTVPKVTTARAFVQRLGKGNGDDSERGRVRQNLMGGRVNFAARAVATADPTLRLNQVRIPARIADVITIPVRVFSLNLKRCREMVLDANVGKVVRFQDGKSSVNLQTLDRVEEEEKKDRRRRRNVVSMGRRAVAERLKPGDVLERSILPGDIAVVNRQPSLHKASMMAYEVTIAPVPTVSFNMSVCKALNADFDGDEINLHFMQSLLATAEAETLMKVETNIVNPQNNRPSMGLIYDAVVGVYALTLPSTFLDYEMMMRLRNRCFSSSAAAAKDDGWRIPHPAVFTPHRAMWTGKQAFSTILPEEFVYGGTFRPFPRGGESETGKPCGFVDWDEAEFEKDHDQACLVLRGEMLCGILSSATMGNAANNIVHSLHNRFGSTRAAEFISNVQFLVNEWCEHQGFSTGLSDCALDREDEARMREFRKTMRDGDIPSMSDVEISKLRGGVRVDHFVTDVAGGGKETWARRTRRFLNKRTNGLLRMVLAGSKGSITNVSQMCEILGQQTTGGSTTCILPKPSSHSGSGARFLPHFRPGERTPISRGYVESNYCRGLSPAHYFAHAVAGNVGVTDTATKTGRTGYAARQLVKSLENVAQFSDGTVRRNNSDVIQFQYGDDGFKGEKFEWNPARFFRRRMRMNDDWERKNAGKCDEFDAIVKFAQKFVRETMRTIKRESGLMKFTRFLLPMSFVEMETDFDAKIRDDDDDETPPPPRLSRSDTNALRKIVMWTMGEMWRIQGIPVSKECGESISTFHDVVRRRLQEGTGNALLISLVLICYTPTCLIRAKRGWSVKRVERFMEKLLEEFERARVETSESVGALAAQSISEPATQMTLSSFHYVSNPLMQLTAGVTRLEELLRHERDSTPLVRIVARNETISKSIHPETSVRDLFSRPSELDRPSDSVTESWERRYRAVFLSEEEEEEEETEEKGWIYRVQLAPERLIESNLSLLRVRRIMFQEFRALGMYHSEESEIEDVYHSCFITELPVNYELPVLKFRFRKATTYSAVRRAVVAVESTSIDGIKGTEAVERKGLEVSLKWKSEDLRSMESPRETMERLWNLFTEEEIDHTKTVMNSVRIAFKTLGIEAARTVLLRELRAVVSSTSYVNDRHLKLLVDVMTHTGTIRDVTRGGLHADNESPLGRASYETTVASFVDGSINGTFDPMTDTSARIAMGTEIAVGTAANFSLVLDVDSLTKNVRERETTTIKRSKLSIPSLSGTTTTGGFMSSLGSFLTATTTRTTTAKVENEPVWYGSDDDDDEDSKKNDRSQSPTYLPSSPPDSPAYLPSSPPTTPPPLPPSSRQDVPEYSPYDEHYGTTTAVPEYSPDAEHYGPTTTKTTVPKRTEEDLQRLRNIEKLRGIMKGFS